MANLQHFKAKICLTASGALIHQGKILLVKHKKLGIWLAPGGHIEADELPHQAAEREFWEETGVKVRAIQRGFFPALTPKADTVEFLPLPISSNLHWISRENYDYRTAGHDRSEKTKHNWGKGCEQHMDYRFLMEPIGSVEFKENEEETLGIAWWGPEEIIDLETSQTIKAEIGQAFELVNRQSTIVN